MLPGGGAIECSALPSKAMFPTEANVNALVLRWFVATLAMAAWCVAADYDIAVLHGRVIDPESGLDAIRHIGIKEGKIAIISSELPAGARTIDARGLIVSPGFIDLHVHDMTNANHRFQALDGVTSALELEIGVAEIDRWYAERAGKNLIHYGVSIGHAPARMAVLGDRAGFLPAGSDRAARHEANGGEIEALKDYIERELQRGAVAVGFGLGYTPAASRWEIIEMFRVAARHRASCHVHLRYARDKEPNNSIAALEEVIAAAAITGAPLHVVHIQSTGGPVTPQLLQMIGDARQRGLDMTTECYPYTAGMTDIKSALFDTGWQESLGITYSNLQWSATGERLTAETFAEFRKEGGLVFVHSNTEEIVRGALAHPLTMIASDGFSKHPRGAGTYCRILGRYVREQGSLTWMGALRKMTLMPAQRLEKRVPAMSNKGRLRVGADADLAVFDPAEVLDQATFSNPSQFSTGMRYVLVAGTVVVDGGQLREGVFPGQPIRAPSSGAR